MTHKDKTVSIKEVKMKLYEVTFTTIDNKPHKMYLELSDEQAKRNKRLKRVITVAEYKKIMSRKKK